MGTVSDLLELHDQQFMQQFSDSYESASLLPEDGGPGMSVQELRELHERQISRGK